MRKAWAFYQCVHLRNRSMHANTQSQRGLSTGQVVYSDSFKLGPWKPLLPSASRAEGSSSILAAGESLPVLPVALARVSWDRCPSVVLCL